MTIKAQTGPGKTAPDTNAASHITDHAFMPKGSIAEGEWYTTCGYEFEGGSICNMAEAAHQRTTLTDKDRTLAPRAKPELRSI